MTLGPRISAPKTEHMAEQAQKSDAAAAMTRNAPSQRWVRIIPVALVMYTIAFIDRTNISLALPRISRDLHLDPQQAGTVAGIFFWLHGESSPSAVAWPALITSSCCCACFWG